MASSAFCQLPSICRLILVYTCSGGTSPFACKDQGFKSKSRPIQVTSYMAVYISFLREPPYRLVSKGNRDTGFSLQDPQKPTFTGKTLKPFFRVPFVQRATKRKEKPKDIAWVQTKIPPVRASGNISSTVLQILPATPKLSRVDRETKTNNEKLFVCFFPLFGEGGGEGGSISLSLTFTCENTHALNVPF